MSNIRRPALLAVFAVVVLLIGFHTVDAAKKAKDAADDKPKKDMKPGGVGPEFKIDTFKSAASGTAKEVKYGILAPLNAKPGEKYPLVLCLHGSGGNTVAADVLARKAMREKYPCFIVAPGCEDGSGWATCAALAKESKRPERTENLPVVMEGLRELVKTEAVDPARIYVTGQSMGGVGTWGACARYADFFAAAVPVCGAWDVADVPKMKVPIWAFHGGDDTHVPTHFSRELTAALKAAGADVKYTEFPGVGHGSWGPAYDEMQMWEWMFKQKKNAPADIKSTVNPK